MDEIDLKIIGLLQQNARLKNSELARKLNMPPTTLQERIRRLERREIIQGYQAIIDPSKIGLTVQAYIAVTLDRHEANNIRSFEKGVKKIPHIITCRHLSGRFDYLLHVAVRDLAQLGDLVKTGITSLPDFGKCETFLIFSEIDPNMDWMGRFEINSLSGRKQNHRPQATTKQETKK